MVIGSEGQELSLVVRLFLGPRDISPSLIWGLSNVWVLLRSCTEVTLEAVEQPIEYIPTQSTLQTLKKCKLSYIIRTRMQMSGETLKPKPLK